MGLGAASGPESSPWPARVRTLPNAGPPCGMVMILSTSGGRRGRREAECPELRGFCGPIHRHALRTLAECQARRAMAHDLDHLRWPNPFEAAGRNHAGGHCLAPAADLADQERDCLQVERAHRGSVGRGEGGGFSQRREPGARKGNIEHSLPAAHKLMRGHHAAMPYREVPDFVQALQRRAATAARALEFLILTAARTGEVLGLSWDEIDFERAQWKLPSARMKAGREHRVPLSQRAIDILRQMGHLRTETLGLCFPGPTGPTLVGHGHEDALAADEARRCDCAWLSLIVPGLGFRRDGLPAEPCGAAWTWGAWWDATLAIDEATDWSAVAKGNHGSVEPISRETCTRCLRESDLGRP